MRPVDARWEVNQPFGSYATGGITADAYGTEVQQLVAQYGNYQPYGHAGCDIACPVGTPVHAIADGTVLWADWGTNLPGDDSWSGSGYFARWALYKTFPGIVTVIQHDGWISVYAHLSDAPLNIGDRVTEGQQIALSGNTRSPGVTLGAHLHVEALVDLTYSTGNGLIYGRTDPTPYFGTITPQGTIAPATTQAPEEPDMKAILATDGTSPDVWIGDGITRRKIATLDTLNSITTLKDLFGLDATVQTIPDLWALGYPVDQAIESNISSIPLAILTAQFRTKAGAIANVAGALSEILSKPSTVTNVTSAPAAVDVDVLVARLKAELPAAVLAELTAKLTK